MFLDLKELEYEGAYDQWPPLADGGREQICEQISTLISATHTPSQNAPVDAFCDPIRHHTRNAKRKNNNNINDLKHHIPHRHAWHTSCDIVGCSTNDNTNILETS